MNTQAPPVDVANCPLTLATRVRPCSVPTSEPLPLPVSGVVSDLNTTLLSTAVTLPLSLPLPANEMRYCTGESFSVPVRLACPCALLPCWLLIWNVPVRFTEPSASHVTSSGPNPAGAVGAGGDVWLNAALADLNFVRLLLTEIGTALLRPSLLVSASATVRPKLATADRK